MGIQSAVVWGIALCLAGLTTWCVFNRKRLIARARLRWQMNRGQLDLETIAQLWASAKGVYKGPVGPGARVTIEFEALLLVTSAPASAVEGFLASRMNDPNPILAAYCLTALRDICSPRLEDIPEELLARRELISVHSCCFGCHDTLGGFASNLIEQRQTGG